MNKINAHKNSAERQNFEQEAKEGWDKMSSSTNLLAETDAKYGFKRRKSNRNLKFVSFVGLLFSISAIFIFYLSKPNLKKSAIAETQKIELIEKTDIKIPEKIQELSLNHESKRIKIKEIKQNFAQKSQFEDKRTLENEEQQISLTLKKPETLKQKENIDYGIKREKVAEKYVYNLLIIDYTKIRKDATIAVEQSKSKGLEAKYEKTPQDIDDFEWQKTNVPYNKYIDKTMQLFSLAQYKSALTRFEEILRHYPEDLNSLFYGGLSFYNLGEYSQAEIYFSKAKNHEFINFKEDATWYLSKSFLEKKENQKAKKLLGEIVLEKGFYKVQAEKLLKML
jgi:hypothetical protein